MKQFDANNDCCAVLVTKQDVYSLKVSFGRAHTQEEIRFIQNAEHGAIKNIYFHKKNVIIRGLRIRLTCVMERA